MNEKEEEDFEVERVGVGVFMRGGGVRKKEL